MEPACSPRSLHRHPSPFNLAFFHLRRLLCRWFVFKSLFSFLCVHSVIWWYERGERSWHWSPAFDRVSLGFVPLGAVDTRHPSSGVTVQLTWWQLTMQSKWSSIHLKKSPTSGLRKKTTTQFHTHTLSYLAANVRHLCIFIQRKNKYDLPKSAQMMHTQHTRTMRQDVELCCQHSDAEAQLWQTRFQVEWTQPLSIKLAFEKTKQRKKMVLAPSTKKLQVKLYF